MNELINILTELAIDIDFHDSALGDDDVKFEKFAHYFEKFQNFYLRVDRHRYSEISKYIGEQQQDEIDILRDNLSCIIECAEYNGYDKSPEKERLCLSKINKLYDHVELEVARYSSLQQMNMIVKHHQDAANELDSKIRVMTDTVSETQDKSKHLSEQLISILGIFAGIIITFSFATNIVGETVASLAKSDVIYWGFILCLLGIVFLNTLAFLLSFVTKLSGHEFSKKFPWLIYIITNIVLFFLISFLFCKMH